MSRFRHSASKMELNQLGQTDMKVSSFSLGASAFGSVYGKTDDEECARVVEKAIASGINMIDTAPWYGFGKSEKVLGKILPQIPRNSYYVNTKVGRYQKNVQDMFDFSAQRTLDSVDESLRRVGVEYFDIIQAHDIEFAPSIDIVVNETIPAMEKIKEQGKTKYIGITGYPIEVLKEVVERSPIKPDTVLSYCHGSMNDDSLQNHIQFFKDRGIGVINASGLAMGLLTDRGPPDWHPAGSEIKRACKNAASYCQEMGVNISKLAIDFSLSLPEVATTLVSTSRLEELEDNIEVAQNGITEKEKQIRAEVIERFFDPLENRLWIGVEVEQYWKKMEKFNTK